MKTFKKQIEKVCKNFYYFNIVKILHVKTEFEDTKAAIVSLKQDLNSKRYYTIFYKYTTMKKVDNIGYYESLYDENGECTYNAYIDACEELSKYAN